MLNLQLCVLVNALWEVSYATGHLRPACLVCLAVSLSNLPLPGKPRAAASARRLPTDCPPTTAPDNGSPLLGVAVTAMVRLADGPGVRAAAHSDRMAAATVP